jgi:heme oxygenase
MLQDIHERRKSGLISQDLLRLGAPVPDLPRPGFLPAVKNQYEAFGALYVMEGSSLGGIHIVKMIQRKLPEISDATLFFSGYGDRTLEMWQRFKNILDNISGGEVVFESIQSGARDTFLKFAEWIHSNIRLKMLT